MQITQRVPPASVSRCPVTAFKSAVAAPPTPVATMARAAVPAKQALAAWSTQWQAALKPKDAAAQARLNAEAISTIQDVQKTFAAQTGTPMRAQHAKETYATTKGAFQVPANLDPALAKGPFVPGANLRAIVRISNVSGTPESDGAPDLRGIAIRLTDDQGHAQDLLMNTSEQFMTKDAESALVGARARAHGLGAVVGGILHGDIGPVAAVRMILSGKKVQSKDISLAATTFWSRTPFQLGDYAVKIRLVPVGSPAAAVTSQGDTQLSQDLGQRLAAGPVKYLLQVQGFRDEKRTPMNDLREAWDSPWTTVGELSLPGRDPVRDGAEAQKVASTVDHLAFSIANRWSADPASLKGIGEVNAMREAAYGASATGRGAAVGKHCPYGFA